MNEEVEIYNEHIVLTGGEAIFFYMYTCVNAYEKYGCYMVMEFWKCLSFLLNSKFFCSQFSP